MDVEVGAGPEPVLPGGEEPLPDLLELDLAELGTIEHPVLREVLGELRARAAEPSEMLWGFDNSF
ncbi:FxSxx-COOH cyclophane-containing RiPP peptide [Streptomyces sp. AC512_CC834]|uniref:FxSxx-COOH cyclophane-containing RiPP peptide n=1 Tax=Streptomyces sp. AC512_CC834 TaxID=2823691 RepID=UPI001C26B9F3|nr:FxSxx-COOH cyclophane-containing RiPP peptide [Streptomyces sp. AC512_CC834]